MHPVRKFAHLLLLGAFVAGPGYAQPTVAGIAASAFPVRATVAQLPAAGSGSHGMRIVTNGASATDCTVGGGSTWVVCIDTGAAWVAFGGGGVDTDDQTGAEVPLTDAGAFFTTDNVEAALQQVGPTMTNARTPTAHASTHTTGQSDALSGTLAVDVSGNATTATTANSGDSATAFFAAGTIDAARLPAVTALSSACTDAQVLGGTAAGTGVECQADATGTDSADDLSDNDLGDLANVVETGEAAGRALVGNAGGGWEPSADEVCLQDGTNCPAAGASSSGTGLQYGDGAGGFSEVTSSVVSGANVTFGGNVEVATGLELQLPLENVAATPTLNFGDGDTGIYESADDVLNISVAGATSWKFETTVFQALGIAGAKLASTGVSATVATVLPRGLNSAGLGSAANDDGRLIAGAVSRLSFGSLANNEGVGFMNGNFTADSDARSRVLTARAITTTATPGELFLNGTSTRMALPNDTSWTFSCTVTARRTDANDETAGYKLEGVIDRNASAAATALVGTVTKTVLAEDTAAWDVDATADTTNGALIITVTGEASKTIRWISSCSTTEVTG